MTKITSNNSKVINVNYNASPTAARFHASRAFVRGMRGPVGSGKSVACCLEGFLIGCRQHPNDHGIRLTRGVVVRNTLPELRTTTMKTWKDWFPPGNPKKGFFGPMTQAPPFTHNLVYGMPDGTTVNMEVIFLAMDKPEDQKKLLSLEPTWIWLNEAREIPKDIVDASTSRVGRYPRPEQGGCTQKAVFMDTNPPDDSHWWYKSEIEETPEGWQFFTQPGGLDPDAENLENLLQPHNWRELNIEERRAHGRKYYEDMSAGKSKEWISVYVGGKFGFIKHGEPVFSAEWNPDWHVASEDIPVNPRAPITLGIDSSGRYPAAILLQEDSFGQTRAIDEVCIMDEKGMGAERFCAKLRDYLAKEYRDCLFGDTWGDPAGGHPGALNEETYFSIFEDAFRGTGIHIRESPGLRITPRLDAVKHWLTNTLPGKPGHPLFLVSPKCKYLVRGFNGGYMFKTISTAGYTRHDDKPFKNKFANVHDALQYGACGLGALREVLGQTRAPQTTTFMDTHWSP